MFCKELTYLTLFWTEEEANLSSLFFVIILIDLLQTYRFCAKFISAHFLKTSSCSSYGVLLCEVQILNLPKTYRSQKFSSRSLFKIITTLLVIRELVAMLKLSIFRAKS